MRENQKELKLTSISEERREELVRSVQNLERRIQGDKQRMILADSELQQLEASPRKKSEHADNK